MVQLHRERSSFETRGARLIVVGNGKPWFIQGFRDKLNYDGEVYTDPSLETFRALRLARGVRSSLNIHSLRKAYRAYRGGFRQTGTRGDPWQQGGVFVIDANGTMRFSYASEHAGDHPLVAKLMAVLDTPS